MSTTVQHPTRYQPTGDDHLIYELVKMQGKKQSLVATMFSINQSTVSRILQRYERWQARANARENGRLGPQERLRAQRCQTFERNELILASCLRIADEMEGFTDVTKRTIRRPGGDSYGESEVRTEHGLLDRSGVAARFLRLAFRVNMEQLKLAELAEPAAPEELSDEELAREAAEAAADAAQIAAARQSDDDQVLGATAGSSSSAPDLAEPAVALSPSLHPSVPPSPSPLHNLHNEDPLEIAATNSPACTCASQSTEKNPPRTCIVGRSGHRAEGVVADRPEPQSDLSPPIPPHPTMTDPHPMPLAAP